MRVKGRREGILGMVTWASPRSNASTTTAIDIVINLILKREKDVCVSESSHARHETDQDAHARVRNTSRHSLVSHLSFKAIKTMK